MCQPSKQNDLGLCHRISFAKMAGKKRAVPTIIIYSIFDGKKHEIIDKFDHVVPPSSAIWEHIKIDKRIKNAMTSKAIYTDALKWWKNQKKKEQSTEPSDISFISAQIEPPNSISSVTLSSASDERCHNVGQ